MKKVMIPDCSNPFVVYINGVKYSYPAGTEQEVPDEVAIVIEAHNEQHNAQPEPVQPPFNSGSGSTDGGSGGNSGGNSGGGGATSLEDLLPAEVILPETNPMFYDGFLWISQAFTLVDGEEYIVNWNGTDYRCICTPMEYGGMAGLGLGNIGAINGGMNTGEPFVVAALDAESAAYTGFPGLAADLMGATSATVSICEPKKIPDEYLPEKVCYLYGATGTYNYLYNSPDTSNALNRTTAARLRKLVENGTTVWFVSSDSLLDTYLPCHISFNKEFGYGAIMIGIPGLSATNTTYFTAEFEGQT